MLVQTGADFERGSGWIPRFQHTVPQHIENVLEGVKTRACVDTARVFVASEHLVGITAYLASCRLPLAGIAMYGAGFVDGVEMCKPRARTAVLMMGSRNGKDVPFDGGQGCVGSDLLGHVALERLFAKQGGCDGLGEPRGSDSLACRDGQNCDAAVRSCLVRGATPFFVRREGHVIDAFGGFVRCDHQTAAPVSLDTAFEFFAEVPSLPVDR